MGTSGGREFQEQQVQRCHSRTVLLWAGGASEGGQKERWIGEDCEAGQVIVKTLAFIWSGVNSQFGADK